MGRVLVAAFPRPCVPNRTSNSAGTGKFLKSLLFVIPGPRDRSPKSTTTGHGVAKRGEFNCANCGYEFRSGWKVGKTDLPAPQNDAEGGCCGLAKMQHCDGFAAVQLSNPAAARTIALSLCAPCAVTQRQAPVVRLNQAGAFSLPPPRPFRRRGKCRGGFETAPTNGVRIRRGGSPKNATRFLGCPALPRPLSAFPAAHIRATQCVAPTKVRKRRGGF